MRIVVSLSTIPSRVSRLGLIFDCLRGQTRPADKVYLNLPEFCQRTGEKYPPIPKDIDTTGITINRCQDIGPLTKLAPTLEQETDPDTLIITIDDDAAYIPTTIEHLEKYAGVFPNSALGCIGVVLGKWFEFLWMVHGGREAVVDANTIYAYICSVSRPTRVSILYGSGVCAYRRKFFGPDFTDTGRAPPEMFYHDDVWISGNLALANIDRLVVPVRFPILWGRGGDTHALSKDKMTMYKRFIPAMMYFYRQGAFQERQEGLSVGLIFILLLVVIVFGVVFYLSRART